MIQEIFAASLKVSLPRVQFADNIHNQIGGIASISLSWKQRPRVASTPLHLCTTTKIQKGSEFLNASNFFPKAKKDLNASILYTSLSKIDIRLRSEKSKPRRCVSTSGTDKGPVIYHPLESCLNAGHAYVGLSCLPHMLKTVQPDHVEMILIPHLR